MGERSHKTCHAIAHQTIRSLNPPTQTLPGLDGSIDPGFSKKNILSDLKVGAIATVDSGEPVAAVVNVTIAVVAAKAEVGQIAFEELTEGSGVDNDEVTLGLVEFDAAQRFCRTVNGVSDFLRPRARMAEVVSLAERRERFIKGIEKLESIFQTA